MPYATYRPELMGSAWLEGEDRVEAGSMQQLVLTYKTGRFGLDDSGSIKIGFRFATDMGNAQFTDPKAPGYTTAKASNGAPLVLRWEFKRNIRPWSRSLYVGVSGDYLAPGDTITICFGDRSQGSPGIRMQTYCEHEFEFRVFVDAFATYDYVALPQSPKLAIVPGAGVHWHAVAPSLVEIGKPFRVGVKVEDKWRNPSDHVDQSVAVTPSAACEGLPSDIAFSAGQAIAVLEGLKLREAGEHRLEFTAADGTRFSSNPIRAVAAAEWQHAWGDTHGQSNETLGTNTAEEYFTFGRDLAMLDVIGHQGNDFQITDEFWAELNQTTRAFDRPGSFVCIPGYEWSANTAIGGDRNVHYLEEGEPIFRSSHAQVLDMATEGDDAHDASALFAKLDPARCVVAAHVGGRYADIAYAHDPQLERAIEVHSSWGTFEWIIEEAMRCNYRIGIVANSDGHKGRPGACYPGASFFGSMGGLTCFLSNGISRPDIFEAMRARRHYATTGARIFLDVEATFENPAKLYDDPTMQEWGGQTAQRLPMGSIVRTEDDQVEVAFDISATAPLERIDIFDGLDLIETIRPNRPEAASRRIRIHYQGAACRGRSRAVLWEGKVAIDGNQLQRAEIVNNWNLDRGIRNLGPAGLEWSAVTTGNFGALDLWLEHGAQGQLEVRTSFGDITVDLASWDGNEIRHESGGISRALSVQRFSEENAVSSARFVRQFSLQQGQERRLYVRLQQADGHQAWSSPIYIAQ